MAKMNLDKESVTLLAQILQETGLSEIEYECDNLRIKVSSQRSANIASNVMCNEIASIPGMSSIAAQNQVVNAPYSGTAEVPTNKKDQDNNVIDISKSSENVLKSPMVGTVYMAPTPKDKPFVNIGDKVTKGQTLLIIEAMKVLNMIKSPKDGVIKTFFVKNEDPVEYDQPLLIIE